MSVNRPPERQLATSDFVVSYDGPALVEHTIPVRDLAPALLALGQVFDRANSVVNGDTATVSLEIRAATQGSFEVELVVKVFNDAVTLFSSPPFSAAANLTQLVLGGGSVGIGVFSLVKKLRGAEPRQVDHSRDDVVLEIDNVRLTISPQVLALYKDVPLRQQLEAVVRPVAKHGIERVVFREGSQELERIEKTDLPSFLPESQASLSGDRVTQIVIPRQRLKPAWVGFVHGRKWKLNDGERTRLYTMSDDVFMRRVENGEISFAATDTLVCEVLMTQTVDAGGRLRMEYEISRVLDHEHYAQPSLFDGGGSDH